MKHLTKLLHLSLEMLRGPDMTHFTALTAINRIMDLCVTHHMYHPWEHEDDTPAAKTKDANTKCNNGPLSGNMSGSENAVHAQLENIIRGSPKISRGSPKHRHSSWRNRSVTHQDSIRSFKSLITNQESGFRETGFMDSECDSAQTSCDTERTPIEVLINYDPSQIITILQNAITNHKSIMGSRHKCSPSVRWRHCTYHCLQILSARILTVMCHGNCGQHKVVNDGHIKILMESLDPNHDPVSIHIHFPNLLF